MNCPFFRVGKIVKSVGFFIKLTMLFNEERQILGLFAPKWSVIAPSTS